MFVILFSPSVIIIGKPNGLQHAANLNRLAACCDTYSQYDTPHLKISFQLKYLCHLTLSLFVHTVSTKCPNKNWLCSDWATFWIHRTDYCSSSRVGVKVSSSVACKRMTSFHCDEQQHLL